MARRRRRSSARRRTRSAGGFGRRFGGFISTDALKQAGVGTAGFVGCNYIANMVQAKIAAAGPTNSFFASANGRALTKAAIALGVGALMRKFAPKYAAAFTVGGLTSAGVDLARQYAPQFAGVNGMGEFGIDNVQALLTPGDVGIAADDAMGQMEDEYVIVQ